MNQVIKEAAYRSSAIAVNGYLNKQANEGGASMLGKALPYLGAAALGAGGLYGGQKLYEYINQPAEEKVDEAVEQQLMSYPEASNMMDYAYSDPMYGAYDDLMLYGAYDPYMYQGYY